MRADPKTGPSGRLAAVLYFCFFFSGAAGLIYEVLWARYLALYVGGTGLAQVIVLATFMGGIAAGSWVLGKRADRVASPLKLYAWLEMGIGVYALFYETLHFVGRDVFIAIVRAAGPGTAGLAAGKVAACALTILLPTFLMGGTLPALGRYMIRNMDAAGPRIARLYFLNSLGAVFGCLLAGFFLIRAFGLQFSMVLGGAMNIAVGVIALMIASSSEGGSAGSVRDSAVPRPSSEPLSRPLIAILLAAAGVSGAVSMMYEVAWIRLLALVLGSSTYAFSLMLATFILGLSIGGYLLSLRQNPGGYRLIFALSSMGVGLTVLLCLPFYARLPFWFNQIAASLSREPATFPLYQFCQFFLCALVMIVPTVLQGITLPAATRALLDDVGYLGRRVGTVFAVNTLGTLLGVVFAGFFGLPGLGIKGTLELGVFLNIALGGAVLWTARDRPAFRRVAIASTAAVVLVTAGYGLGMGSWDRDVLAVGAYRTRKRIPSHASLVERARTTYKTVFYRDGIDATVVVRDEFENVRVPQRALVVNGKVDASTVGDLPTQKCIGHLPMFIHKNPENVLVVGIGSGATIGAVLAHDAKHVDVVEISRDVIDASRLFESVNGRYWEDPRVRVYWEDAKTFLQVTDQKYDVIVSEPTNPWIAGIAGVFSQEYYETCRDHLAPGGLFVQWIQGYELEDATLFLMLETFRSCFSHVTLWNPAGPDIVMIGSKEAYRPDFARMELVFGSPKVRGDLQAFGVESVPALLATQMADFSSRPAAARWSESVHSDYFPILDFVAPRGFFVGSRARGARWIDARMSSPANARLWIQKYFAQSKAAARQIGSCYRAIHRNGSLSPTLAPAWAREWAGAEPRNGNARNAEARELGFMEHGVWKRLPDEESKDPEVQAEARILRCKLRFREYSKTRSYLHLKDAEPLLADIRALLREGRGGDDAGLPAMCGRMEYDLGFYRDAASNLAKAAKDFQRAGERDDLILTGIDLCRAFLASGDVNSALAAYREFLAPHAADPRVWLTKEEITAAAGTRPH